MNLAELKFLPFNYTPMNWLPADGQLLSIEQNTTLFSILGATYGGNGRTTFGVPDLRGRAAVHPKGDIRLGALAGSETISVPSSPQNESNMQPYNGVNHIICLKGTQGIEPMLGEIRLFAGFTGNMQGWKPCDGLTMSTNVNQALFSLLGTYYGGDGRTTFGLPDLCGRVPIGAGTGTGLARYFIGQTGGSEKTTLPKSDTGSNIQPFNSLYPVIGSQGFIGPGDGMPGYLGEIKHFAGNFAPKDWAFCNGQQLQVNQYPQLFSMLGNVYGGDGRSTFALPDLQGRVALGAGNSNPELTPRPTGQSGGSATVKAAPNATIDNMQPFTAINYMIATQGSYPAQTQ